MGGQSNMEGWQDLSGFPTDVQSPITSVPFYTGNTSSPVANTLTHIQGNTSQVSRTGPELAFAHALTDATSSPFAIIKYARGATSLYNDWAAGGDATTTGDATQYVNFQNTVTSGLAAMQAAQPSETFQIGGFLWTQGERDANHGQTTAQYEANLTNFFNDVRLTYGSDLPIFYSTLSDSQTTLSAAQRANIVNAQVNVEALSPNNHLINTDGFGIQGDNVHFNGAGYTALGTAYSDAVIDAGVMSVSSPPEQLFLDVANFSFEADNVGSDNGFNTTTPTGWTNLGGGAKGTMNPGSDFYSDADAVDANPSGGTLGDMDDNQVFFTLNNGGISQTLADSIVVGNTYTMTVAVGNRDVGSRLGFSGYDIRLLAGGVLVESTSSTINPGDGTFTDVSFSYTAEAGDSGLLSIELWEINGGSGKSVEFDNVRLSFAAFVPEPSSTALLGLGGLALILRRKRG